MPPITPNIIAMIRFSFVFAFADSTAFVVTDDVVVLWFADGRYVDVDGAVDVDVDGQDMEETKEGFDQEFETMNKMLAQSLFL